MAYDKQVDVGTAVKLRLLADVQHPLPNRLQIGKDVLAVVVVPRQVPYVNDGGVQGPQFLEVIVGAQRRRYRGYQDGTGTNDFLDSA